MSGLTLATLAQELPHARLSGESSVLLTGLTHDSRRVEAGFLFAAVPGMNSDGREHIGAALAAGAAAVLCESPGVDLPVPQVLVPQARAALARAARLIYGRPGSRVPVVGITGTNGKTTIAFLIAAMLESAGFAPLLCSSIGNRHAGTESDTTHTTPEAPDIHRLWAEAQAGGADALVMEASSHGLLLQRTAEIGFNVGVFTNLTRDHLDYHPDLAAYRGAKTRLFGMLPSRGAAVVSADDPAGAFFARATSARLVTYGTSPEARVRVNSAEVTATGIVLDVTAGKQTFQVRSPLYGRFNVTNLLAAVATGYALKLDVAAITRGLTSADRIPGRAERIDCGQPFVVLNDFAHTPDALTHILTAARELTRGRLHVVFGCGGDRDRGKRAQMGKAARENADSVVITSDNPRTEDPLNIIADITAGSDAQANLVIEPDRAAAIRKALAALRPEDTLVVAGKGHERYQIVGHEKRRFDDAEVLRTELKQLGFAG